VILFRIGVSPTLREIMQSVFRVQMREDGKVTGYGGQQCVTKLRSKRAGRNRGPLLVFLGAFV